MRQSSTHGNQFTGAPMGFGRNSDHMEFDGSLAGGSQPPTPTPAGVLTVPVSRQRIRFILSVGVLFLTAMHLVGLFSIFVLNRSNLYGIIDRFHLDSEANIPAWYASLLMLACAVVIGLIAAKKRIDRDPFARHWIGMALLLLFMSVDEAARLHELLTRPMRELTGNVGGWLPFGWVMPGVLLALIVGVAYLRFLAHLPPATRRRFVLAGAIFLGAAIGLETVGGWYITIRGNGVGYNLLASTEEVLEKLSVILAIDAALAYLATQAPIVRLALIRNDSSSSPA